MDNYFSFILLFEMGKRNKITKDYKFGSCVWKKKSNKFFRRNKYRDISNIQEITENGIILLENLYIQPYTEVNEIEPFSEDINPYLDN